MICNTEIDCFYNVIKIADIIFEPLLYICVFAVTFLYKSIPGRDWLVGFFTCYIIPTVFYSAYSLQNILDLTNTDYFQAYFSTTHVLYSFSMYILLPIFLFNLWSEKTLNISAKRILFSWHGRVSRRFYWLVTVAYIAMTLAVFEAVVTIGNYPMIETWFSEGLMYLTMFVILGLLFWVYLMITIKRWHDLNMSGWMTLCSLVPYIGTIGCTIYLGFAKGKKNKNRFGEALIQ